MTGRRWACAVALAAAVTGVQAQTLANALEAAARHDPMFQAARAELDASRQLLPIARAARLPSVTATVSDAKIDGTREVPGPLGAVRSSLDYRSPNYALSVRVPLLNAEAWHRERGAQARVEQAEQIFRARRLELLDRTATAWLNLRKAEQLLALAAEPVRAAAAQAEQARNQLAAGEATRMDVAEAQAALAQAAALEAAARSAVTLARLGLEQLMGPSTPSASTPASAVPPDLPPTWPGLNESVQEVIARAKASHPTLAARRQAVVAAATDIRRNEAGHLPRADLVLSASSSRSDSLSTLNQAVNQRVLSAQLNLPLYSGGGVLASVAQATAELRRAEAELAIRTTNVSSLAEQVRAARDRFEVGEVTRTDVAQAEARFAGAEAGLAAARARLDSARAAYEQLVGRPPVQLAEPPPVPSLPADLEAAIAQARSGNPDILAARAAASAAEEAVGVARSELSPRLALSATAGLQETYSDATFRDTNMGLTAQLSVPIYSGGLLASKTREARLRADQSRYEAMAAERAVSARTAAAWHALLAARQAIAASRARVAAAETALDGAQQELAVGTRITLDVLDQESELLEARLGLVDAQRSEYVAAHELLAAMGGLTLESVGR